MAKMIPVAGHLLSGKVGDVVYVRRGNQVYVRAFVPPHDPRTRPQLKQRSRFRTGVAAWKRLPDAKKEEYRRRGEFQFRTGFQLFMSEFLSAAGPK
jgi:hypothetical protein